MIKQGSSFSRISFEDRQKIEQLITDNPQMMMIDVAKILGRPKSSVSSEIRRCKDDKRYTAIRAQEDADKKKKVKHARLRTCSLSLHEMSKRISYLEQQLEILIDVMKGKL